MDSAFQATHRTVKIGRFVNIIIPVLFLVLLTLQRDACCSSSARICSADRWIHSNDQFEDVLGERQCAPRRR